MLRVIFVSLAVVAIGAGAAAADTVRDTVNNFSIAVPKDWVSQSNPNEDIRVVIAAPDREQTGANCNVVTEAHAPSRTMTQAKIDSDIEQEVTQEAWATMFKKVIFIDNVQIVKTGIDQLNGHSGHYVVATFSTVMPGVPVRLVKLKQYLVAIPGELFFITCSASQDAFDTKESEFQTVFDSFSPINDTVAVNTTAGVPSLTLYAAANFGGVSRLVTRDTPDLASAGWHDAAGSISVGGDGLWQVCAGANYAGPCRLVTSTLQERVAVGSARRIEAGRGGFGLMLQAGGAQGARGSARRH